MVKVCIIAGTNSEQSLCVKAVNGVINEIETTYKISKKFFQIIDYLVMDCTGCKLCFKTRKCPLDQLDAMNKIKNTMKSSDIIIWASPVYSNNVSGSMKNFIDRIRTYIYTMELEHKKGIIISTTSFSGSENVNKYLAKIMFKCGINVVGVYTILDNEILNKNLFLSKISEIVDNILLNINEDRLKEERKRYKLLLLDRFTKPNSYLIENFEGIIECWQNFNN